MDLKYRKKNAFCIIYFPLNSIYETYVFFFLKFTKAKPLHTNIKINSYVRFILHVHLKSNPAENIEQISISYSTILIYMRTSFIILLTKLFPCAMKSHAF